MKYLRYNNRETWEHVIQCEAVSCNNEAFTIKLRLKLEKEAEMGEKE